MDLYEEYIQKSYLARGQSIHKITFLERLMDEYIAHVFTKTEEDKQMLIEGILSTKRIIFDHKLDVLKFIISKRNPEFKIKFPEFYNEMRGTLIEYRNIL